MTRLSCTARTCVNNEAGLCGAGQILIEGVVAKSSEDTFCSNFMEDNVANEFKALTNTNYIGELSQIFSSMEDIKMNPEIECHARSCFYNGNGKCEARDIIVIGDNAKDATETVCQTFVES